MQNIFIIPLAILTIGLFITWLRVLYYKRKNVHLQVRLDIAKAITKVIKKLKKDSDLTERQKAFFNFLLDTYKSRRIVQVLLFSSLFDNTKENNQKKLGKFFDSGLKENADMVAFVVLCVLHASTYNFFLGGIFRKIMFADILKSKKLVKAAAERKDFVNRTDVLSAFGGMLRDDTLKGSVLSGRAAKGDALKTA